MGHHEKMGAKGKAWWHWCRGRRRRLLSMFGVGATTTCLLFLLYTYYSPLYSFSYSPQARDAPSLPDTGISGQVQDSPDHRHPGTSEIQLQTGRTSDGSDMTASTGGTKTSPGNSIQEEEEQEQEEEEEDEEKDQEEKEEVLYYDNKMRAKDPSNSAFKSKPGGFRPGRHRGGGGGGGAFFVGAGRPVPAAVLMSPIVPPEKFVKEKLDMLSVKGDDSDYLFPSCPGDSTVQLNDTYGFLGPFRYLANYKNPCWMEERNGDMPVVHCVPYFYLVGAPKAGSTDVYKRITMHPEVVKPASKETRWFDRNRFLGLPHFTSFLHNFDFAAGVISRSLDMGSNYHSRIVGDGSPSYFFDNRNWPLMPGNEGCQEPRVTVASHIHHLFPGARIIFVLRNPVDRLYSSYLYNHARYEAVSTRTFDMYVREAIKVYNACFERYSLRACANNATVFQQAKVMLIVSLYSVFVQDWMELFPRHQLLFITTEQYNRHMDTRLAKIYHFLGLEPLTPTKMREITEPAAFNQGRHYKKTGPMLPETRTLLEEFYQPYNQQLAKMLNDSEFLWLS